MLTIQDIEEACAQQRPVTISDPVLAQLEYPLQATYYPLGFPLVLSTNSAQVLELAAQLWSSYTQLFDVEPMQLQVDIREGGSQCPPIPDYRVQLGIMTSIADASNFSIYDMNQGITAVWLTSAALAQEDYVRYFFLEASVMCQLAARHATPVHAGCVQRNGVGILLCGDSGAGKSTLSYACAQAGWTYTTDDASYVVQHRDDRMVVGNCSQARFRPSAVNFFPELDGMEVTHRLGAGKPSLELCTTPLQHLGRSVTARIDYIVFLNRRDPLHQDLRPYSKDVARHYMQQAQYGTAAITRAQNASIESLLKAEVLELRYHDLNWAIQRLNDLVDNIAT
jgi:hypothetical protein